jgi:glycosyltransferase involved in cell wall biosynthesis
VATADEISVIHLGNNPHHLWLLDRLGRPRTVVVLHDLVLHHLLVETAGRGWGTGELESDLREACGQAGAALATARSMGMTARRDPFLFAARKPFLRDAEAVVVHSAWAQALVNKENPGLAVGRIGLPVRDAGPVDRGAVRRELGLGDDEVVVMHLGFLTPEKGLPAVLSAVGAAARAGVAVRLVLVGEATIGDELYREARAAGIADRVVATGWIEPDRFRSVPAAADLGVVLRTPSAGETSAAVVRFLACGTPVAVGGRHQFLEWPETAAPRLTPGPSAPADLARLLVAAAKRDPDWERRRSAARKVYESRHTPTQAADDLAAFLSQTF